METSINAKKLRSNTERSLNTENPDMTPNRAKKDSYPDDRSGFNVTSLVMSTRDRGQTPEGWRCLTFSGLSGPPEKNLRGDHHGHQRFYHPPQGL